MDGATASSFSEVRSCFVGEGHGKRQRVNEPIHILNVAIRYKSIVDDTLLSDTFTAFCLAKRAVLVERGIRRITFVVMFEHQHPKFFTTVLAISSTKTAFIATWNQRSPSNSKSTGFERRARGATHG